MGTTGRKKQTLEYTGIAPRSVLTRNLRKGDLGGVIFGCMQSTIKECLSKQLFGQLYSCLSTSMLSFNYHFVFSEIFSTFNLQILLVLNVKKN